MPSFRSFSSAEQEVLNSVMEGYLDLLHKILKDGYTKTDHECDGYGCEVCDYSCGPYRWQEKVTPQERQDLLWKILQQIIGKVGTNSTDYWESYEDSYSKLLEEFLGSYGEEIQTDPRCSGLVEVLLNLDLFPSSENWGTLKMSELEEYDSFGDFWNSCEFSFTDGGDPVDEEWHCENVLQPSMEAVISFCLKVIDTLSLDVDREPSTALVFTRARRVLKMCSDERERVRMAVLRKEAFVSAWDCRKRCWVVKNGVYRLVDQDRIWSAVNKLPRTAWSVDDYGTYEIK